MIIVLSADNSIRDRFLACIPDNLSKEAFLEASGAKGGFAKHIAERMFEMLTVGTVNLRQEYMKYYNKEYTSFETFLYWKYDIDEVTIAEVGGCTQRGSYLALGKLNPGGDNVGWMVEVDNPPAAVEAITEILSKLQSELVDED